MGRREMGVPLREQMQQYKIKCWIGLGLGLGLTILQLKNVISINAIGEPTTSMPKNSIDSVSTTGTEKQVLTTYRNVSEGKQSMLLAIPISEAYILPCILF